MKTSFALIVAILSIFNLSYARASSKEWGDFVDAFKASHVAMKLPWLEVSYVSNLERIQSEDALLSQQKSFQDALESLAEFNVSDLSRVERLEYDLIRYESQLNLERIKLSLRWHELSNDEIPSGGLRNVPMGTEWYGHFLKRWIDASVTPDEIYSLGEQEIARVKSEMKKIQVSSGLDEREFKKHIQDSSFFYNSADEVKAAFEDAQNSLMKKLPEFFPHIESVGPAGIERGTNRELAQVPAFYSRGALHFNYFDKPFDRRQIYWIYLHEAVPGHHYQSKLAHDRRLSKLQNLFRNACYGEGWAAYIEDLALEIGLYDDVFSEFGKWEWDLIRSVRLVLDVGLNYYQWSDEKALAYWKSHIDDLDDIGQREIDRMNRWPAQVVTYKYGAKYFLRLKDEAVRKEGLSLYEFHEKIMDIGPLPMSVIDRYLKNESGISSAECFDLKSSGEVTVTKDIEYYGGADSHPDKHKLDLYLPGGDSSIPLLLWIHGGAWSKGDRKNETELAYRFAERGVGVAAISYRLSRPHLPGTKIATSEVLHPEHIKDVARAFSWLNENRSSWRGETGEMFVGGHSSGAHLASLLATNGKYLEEHGLSPSDIAGVIPIEGAYEIGQYRDELAKSSGTEFADMHIEAIFGANRENWDDASPTKFLSESSTPFLVVTGDQYAFNQYIKPFVEASKGSENIQFYHAKNRNHSTVVSAMTKNAPDPTRQEIIDFIQNVDGQ